MRSLCKIAQVILMCTMSEMMMSGASFAQAPHSTPEIPQEKTRNAKQKETWTELSKLDESCVDCHPSIVEAWRNSPMGSSFKVLTGERDLPPQQLFHTQHPQTKHSYQVSDQGGRLFFSQSKGQVSDERSAHIVIGGSHAQTFLWKDGEALFEAPLTLYGSQWGLSPGYEQRDYGLYRPITPGCLHCHAEPVYLRPWALNRYQAMPTLGIGCARCHGDSRAHVRGRYQGEDVPALNPAHMNPQQAQEICDQCHFSGALRLTRSGRTWADYKPGEALSETIAIFARAERTQGLSSVSHRDRMKLSACHQKGEPLSCVTCHPPHAQTVTDVNAPCVGCHSTSLHPDLLKEGSQSDLSKGCVSCHMRREGLRNVPHLSTLDHWIRRQPFAEPTPKNSEAELIWVNRPHEENSAKTRARDHRLLGRAYFKLWTQGRQELDLRRAYEHLTSGLRIDQDDPEAWLALAELTAEVSLSGQLPSLRGEIGARVALNAAERAWKAQVTDSKLPLILSDLYLRWGRVDDAQRVIFEALRHEPRFGEFLKQAAELTRQSGQVKEGLRYLETAIKMNPFDLRSRFDQALILQMAQRWSEARVALQELLSLESGWPEARLNLGWLEFQDHHPKEALKAFQAVEKLAEERSLPASILAQALSGQALSLESLGKRSKAISIAQRALKTGAPAPGIQSLLGRVALSEDRAKDAMMAFTYAVQEQPKDGIAWWGLAQSQRSIGDLTAAKDAAERAAALGVAEAKEWLMSP